MTVGELKKLDKKIRAIPYPFGTHFPLLRKIIELTAVSRDLQPSEVISQYIAWRYYKL